MFYWRKRGHKPIFWKITKNGKTVNSKDLPPHVFGNSGRETNFLKFFYIFFLLGLTNKLETSTNVLSLLKIYGKEYLAWFFFLFFS